MVPRSQEAGSLPVTLPRPRFPHSTAGPALPEEPLHIFCPKNLSGPFPLIPMVRSLLPYRWISCVNISKNNAFGGIGKGFFFHQNFCVGFGGQGLSFSPAISLPAQDTQQFWNQNSPDPREGPLRALLVHVQPFKENSLDLAFHSSASVLLELLGSLLPEVGRLVPT